MKSLLLTFILMTSSAFANLHLAPPDFDSENGRAIFVDFKEATYHVTYDLGERKTLVRTEITFEAKSTGKPVFDLIPTPMAGFLNNKRVDFQVSQLPNGSGIRMVNAEVGPGTHTLELVNYFDRNTRYSFLTKQVWSAFWIRDLTDRKFLEQYVPSNFEYDQYKMVMHVRFRGRIAKQDIFTNGEVQKIHPNHYVITFPEYFTSSCPYFHTTPKGVKRQLKFHYPSIDGRKIPITVYSSFWSNPKKFKKETIRVMKELEADYGPWAHPSFVAYETLPGTGGMEHAGATQTSFSALDHEMLHSYFAKGVMPANGNAGWIDEAIASWRDWGYQRKPLPGFTGSNLGMGSVYKRNTDNRAYALGREFMSYLDYRLQNVGGLKAFLKGYFSAYKHTVITQEHFKNNLEFFSGLDLTQDFETYIWGTNSKHDSEARDNPVHKRLDSKTLEGML